ncbi:signal recognition particle-docking protein FtsY [Fusobacterium sp. oral taxon 370]|uniref:signal recognition particle-docking protein FtsY n=1 Tax=Fusobacterium sp. oral taxon 370 TaxID=712288 RepID=UPI0002DCD431|nr:signal recognition particle-docking protein FtsY [Fusobacterium sp. oral taxon 370]
MGIFDKLFKRNKNEETEEIEKVEEKKEEIKEKIIEEIKEEVKVESLEKIENEVVEEVSKVEEPVKVNISQRLTKSKEGFFSKLKNIFTSKSKVDDSIYEELEDLLIQSDVGLGMTTNLINELEKKVKANKISETSEVYEILKGLMSEFLLSQDSKVHLKDNKINVILIVGVNGVGKTTTIGKLALKYKKLGKKVLLGAGDTFRAAAVEQLEEWAKRADVDIVKGREGADPASVVYDTLSKAEAIKADVVIIDTAGRLHNKANLMRELEKINNIIKKKIGEQEYESLLVIDGTTGQNGLNQAKEFNSVTDLTGFIVTKLDGTAKGGIVFSVSEELKKPIKFIGLGEKIEDLIEFNAKDFVEVIFN